MTPDEMQQLTLDYVPSQHTIDLLQDINAVLFCGITGAGKDRVQEELLKDDGFTAIVTSTTRLPRENDGVMEQNGREYYFYSLDQAKQMIERGEYFEVAVVHGTIYGVTAYEINRIHGNHKVGITDIDYKGIEHYKKYAPHTKAIFLVPPDFATWVSRLKKRYDTEEDFQAAWPKRRESALKELDWALNTPLCRIVVNDDLGECVAKVRQIIDGDTVSTGGRNNAREILEYLRPDT